LHTRVWRLAVRAVYCKGMILGVARRAASSEHVSERACFY
jgi:hypothetical protein